MTVSTARRASVELTAVGARLREEYSDMPGGSVLRCLSRAVRRLRLVGCPVDRLPEAAEELARTMLEDRHQPRLPGQPRVPMPRHSH
ncbi:MAG TPA: hypothetical protein VFG98_11165 [Intrasporangium sp.]|nr:hypothetical protein [Intrasporangium sp.]